MAENQILINTDASFEPSVAPVAKPQYQFREFSFWTEKAIERSVNRYQHLLHSGPGREQRGLGPDDIDLMIEPAPVANRRTEPTLELPAVFQKRVIGERSVTTLQEWECVVTEIADDTVYALATSVIAREPDQNYIEIPLSEFEVTDRLKLRPGVIFRLIVGFVMKPNGRRAREAILYIRHQLPRSNQEVAPLLDLLVDG